MKRFIGLFLLGAFCLAAQPVWAEHSHGDDKQCALKGNCDRPDCDRCSKEEECPCPIVQKFMKKAKFLLKNADDIGLSEEQVATIKSLKLEAKKAMIQQKAGMEAMMLDMEAKLSEPKLDVEGLNQMIDSGAAQMAGGAKEAVARYAKLKAVLSEEQMKKAKELWKKKKD